MARTAAETRPTGKRASYARSAETRAKILEAALAEAAQTGFHRTSVARIAARAGVAVGNLNYHFGSRRQLLRELMGKLIDDLFERLYAAVPDRATPFFEAERAILRAYLHYVRDNPAYARLVDEVKLHEPELFARGLDDWVALLVKRLRVASRRGELRPMSEAEMTIHAFSILGTRHYVSHMMERTGTRPYPGDDAVIDACLGLVRGGLVASPNREPEDDDKP